MFQAEYILDLQKQLTLMGSETRREFNGSLSLEESIPSMTTVDKVCPELFFIHELACMSRRKLLLNITFFFALKFRLRIPFPVLPLLFPWTMIVDKFDF